MRRIDLFFVLLFASSEIFSSRAEDTSSFEETIDTQEGSENLSGLFVESDVCGPSFASCLGASACFDHSLGCAEDGTIVYAECASAQPCKPCFPNSRCASDASPAVNESQDPSALFVESESCGPEFATCAQAGPCFDHSLGCAEDGSVVFPQCSTALPFCKPCFPNSRCGSDEENKSSIFVESETCGPEFASCANAFPCFDHFMGCAEDGTITFPECSTALPFCKPCFPNSRCASANATVAISDEDLFQDESESALFVESESCGIGFESCAQASNCFDHSMGCAEDGSIIYSECSNALPFCKPCFPNSRCGSNNASEDMESTNESINDASSLESGAPRFATKTAAVLTLIATGILRY